MIKKMILSAILGGLVLFVWSAISGMLPWHQPTIRKFTSEDVVQAAILANAPESGIYVLPNPCHFDDLPQELQADAQRAAMKKAEEGPMLFASLKREGPGSMGVQMLQALLVNIIAAATMAWLLMTTPLRSFFAKVRFVEMIAVLIFVAGQLPFSIWWQFSPDFLLISLLDLLIGWGLAGCVLAWATGRGARSTA